jgi:hypothetical protein
LPLLTAILSHETTTAAQVFIMSDNNGIEVAHNFNINNNTDNNAIEIAHNFNRNNNTNNNAIEVAHIILIL